MVRNFQASSGDEVNGHAGFPSVGECVCVDDSAGVLRVVCRWSLTAASCYDTAYVVLGTRPACARWTEGRVVTRYDSSLV